MSKIDEEVTGTRSRLSSRFRRTVAPLATYARKHERFRVAVIVGLPATVLVVFFILPLLAMIRLSFLTDLPPAEYTVQHYVDIFTEGAYRNILWNTLWVTAVTTAIVVALGYTFAYSMVRFSRRWRAILLLLVLPFWINYIVRMYAWINILQERGVINWLEETLLFVQEPSGYLYTWHAVILGLVYVWLPLATLPFFAAIRGIDESTIEASKDLGAGPIRTFFSVTVPQTYGGLLAGVVLVAIPTFGAFLTPVLLGGTGQMMIGVVIDIYFNQTFNWNFAAAVGTLITAFIVLVIVLGALLGGNVLSSRTPGDHS